MIIVMNNTIKEPVKFPFVVVDIETTGLSFVKNEIIEIGAIRFNIDGSFDKFSSFIKPDGEVPLFIYKLTNIKEEQLLHADKVKSVLTDFYKFIKADDVIVCHNAEFDIRFLNYHLNKAIQSEISNPVLDTLILSRIFLPFLNNHKLSSLTEYFKINLENAHRAIYDAEATGLVLQKITDFITTFVKPEDINFLVTLADFAMKPESDKKKNYYKEIDDYLLKYLIMLRDYMIKYALMREPVTHNPFVFSHYNFVENKADSNVEPTIDEVFAENGHFSKAFDNYELRPGQIEMSNAVLNAFNSQEYLLVEAGTGVGKSLAYLIPSLIFSQKTNKKIVVSTNTKNLQEQLLFKDLPLIIKAVNLSFTAVLVKGRDNYLCLKKWQDIFESFTLKQANIAFSPYEAFGLLYLYLWAINTKTGDVSENHSFQSSPYAYMWKKVATDRHLCSGRKCRFYGRCFLMEIRQKAEKANLLIINHSLLFSDFQNEQSTLGEIEYLVFDEAHNLLHSASGYLGFSLSYPDVQGFLNSIYTIKSSYQSGMMVNLKNATLKSAISSKDKEMLMNTIDSLLNYMDESKEIPEKPFRSSGKVAKINGSYNKIRIKKVDKNAEWIDQLYDLQSYLKKIAESLKLIHGSILLHEAKNFADQDIMLDFLEKTDDKLNQIIKQFDSLIDPDLKKYAYWLSSLEIQIDNYPAGVFNYAPIQVNDILPDIIYSRIKSLVFTSATMSLRNSFKFFVSNMGLDKLKTTNEFIGNARVVLEKVVPSPFNYDEQALILNTSFLPNTTDAFFHPQSRELIRAIIEHNHVGSLVLFTSYKDLKQMYEGLEQTCFEKDILLLAQSISGSRNSILSQFTENGKAVLLGTSSFWEGVDVQGESLSLLILYKLPFQVPTDPIVEAYLEKLESEGKQSFMHYSLPNALLKMRQGIGRLIRSKSDKGVILILDNRITTKDYGKYFKEIIPTKIYSTKNPIETIDAVTKKLKKK